MNFETISTERLLLRRLTPLEYKYIFENFDDERVKKELGITTHEELEKEREKNQKGHATYNRSILAFQLFNKAGGELIGGCGFHSWSADHSRAELGYIITKEEYKRKGLMAEALEAVIAYGFREMKLNRIEALVGPGNKASLRLLEKNKFVYEGLLRKHYFINGQHEDSVLFSLLKEEYNP